MWQQQWNIILTHIFDQNWVGCPLDVDWPLGSGNLAVHCDCWDKFTGFHEAEGAQKLSRPWPTSWWSEWVPTFDCMVFGGRRSACIQGHPPCLVPGPFESNIRLCMLPFPFLIKHGCAYCGWIFGFVSYCWSLSQLFKKFWFFCS